MKEQEQAIRAVHSYERNRLVTLCMSCHGKTHWEHAKREGHTNIYEWIGDRP